MADAENVSLVDENVEGGEGEEGKASKKKKPKKKSKLRRLLIVMILVIGACIGLQLSGGADLRPALYSIVPKIPGIGEWLMEVLNVPAVYSLSAEERRQLELSEWEKSLAEKKRALDEQDVALQGLSDDLHAKSSDLDAAYTELTRKLQELAEEMTGGSGGSGAKKNSAPSPEDDVEAVINTFGEMSPKNAAAILEKLPPDLATTILNGLDNSFRARTLAKMEATIAADLMQRLTELQAALEKEE